jgi:uncharacterized protein YbjT (DUF2867 family)
MKTGRKIAVTGATGRVGRHVVDVLESEGHEVVPVSRSGGVDVVTGDGLADALAGVQCVIDAATGSSPDQAEATEFFTASARNLLEIGERAGVKRIVMVSIIGTDRFTAGYGVAKLGHEQALLAGPIPTRILRASQFHEFVEQLMEWGRQGRCDLRPEDAHPDGRRTDRRGGARRSGQRIGRRAGTGRGYSGDRGPARGAPRRPGETTRRPTR